MAKLRFHSPMGDWTLVADDHALTELRFEPPAGEAETPETSLLHEAARQLEAYLEGTLREFTIPLSPKGTAFQQRVWDALREIPYGQTVSYSDIAQRIGNPKAVRAVGMANNRNPLPIFIPCHRVVGKNGSLVGYGGGLPVKEHLLALEQRKP